MKKVFIRTTGLLLAIVLGLTGLTGCRSGAGETNQPDQTSTTDQSGSNDNQTPDAQTPDVQTPPTQLKVAFLSWAPQPPDLGKVQDALNDKLREKINVEVELIPINGGEYVQKTNLMIQNGDDIDLLVTGTGLSYYVQAATGQLMELDELLDKHGQGIKEVLGDYLAATAAADGKTYAVPVLQSYSAATTFVMRKDLVEKYEIDVDAIQTMDDLEAVFRIIKENEPDIVPVLPESPGSGVFGLGIDVLYDPLGDTIGVLPNYGQGTTVVDLFETEEYKEWVYRLRDWYQKGYILQDAATNNETAAALLAAGRGFGHFIGTAVGAADSASISYGMPMAAATIGDAFISGGNVSLISWAVASQSKSPDKAVEFLNLLYTDEEIVNLIVHGIEGEHYIKVSDNVITYPEGLTALNHPYNFNLAWEFGNTFLSYVVEGTDPDIWAKAQAANDTALKSKAMGFIVDVEPIKTEIAAVTSVIGQYLVVLGTGSVDPDKYLPEFISKLKDAGIDKIVMEKQKQLDAWLAQ